jgi:hypothetical protein
MSDLGGEYARIFGPKLEEGAVGRSRLCKTCGDWHSLSKPWPHNCRPPAPPRSDLSAPMLAPTFGEFVTGQTDTAQIIGDRRAKREFMERHELAEYEPISPPPEPTEREWEAEFVQDFKRAQEEDPLNRPPVDVIGRTDTEGAGEIDMADVEIAG